MRPSRDLPARCNVLLGEATLGIESREEHHTWSSTTKKVRPHAVGTVEASLRAPRPYTDYCLPAVAGAAAAATAAALTAILCFVDVEDASVEFCAVHGCNRGSAYCGVGEGHETKPA